MFEFEENLAINAKIKVIGVGGGGGNSIQTMMKERIDGVDFVAINTDVQALKKNDAMVKIQIGSQLTRGLGSGSNPQVGREAAIEDEVIIREALSGSDMVFITAGMGGGTGTGAAPVIGKIAKDLGILTVGVVTKPFSFEGKKRFKQAEEGIDELRKNVDTLICLPNDNLLGIAEKDTPIVDSFKMVDHVVLQAVRGISDLITTPGLINLDFADIKTIMHDSGLALMGTGMASGEDRAITAARLAISSPLLENISISGATGIILNIMGTSSMTLFEVNAASKLIQQECDEDVNIIFGTVIDDSMNDDIRVTVIATGFGKQISNIKQQAIQEHPDKTYREWFASHSTTPRSAPEKKSQVTQSIRDVFDQMSGDDEPVDENQDVVTVVQNKPAPSVQPALFAREQPVAKIPETRKQSLWGDAPASASAAVVERAAATATSNPGLSRKRTGQAQDRAELQRISQEIDMSEMDGEEYDIPAFIRRRAD